MIRGADKLAISCSVALCAVELWDTFRLWCKSTSRYCVLYDGWCCFIHLWNFTIVKWFPYSILTETKMNSDKYCGTLPDFLYLNKDKLESLLPDPFFWDRLLASLLPWRYHILHHPRRSPAFRVTETTAWRHSMGSTACRENEQLIASLSAPPKIPQLEGILYTGQ